MFQQTLYSMCIWAERLIWYTVKNAVELFFAFHPDVEKIQYP
jgi:hypothetical protein